MTTDAQFLLIKVKNVADLVKSKGGAAGAVAYNFAPQTVTNKVYDDMKAQLSTKLKEQGVEADVSIMATPSPSWVRQPTSELLVGAGLGAGVLGLGWLVWRMVK